jgi:RNA polymerase sigma-70 factor (ECF subfamily)
VNVKFSVDVDDRESKVIMKPDAHDYFVEQLTSNQHRIFAYIVTLVASREDAEDLFQSTCLILWKKWQEYDTSRNFLSWARGIALNEVRNKFRTTRQGRLSLSDDLLAEIAEVRERTDDLLESRSSLLGPCLSRLEDLQRRLIERCYLGSEPIRAIADEMQISPAALTMRLQRIRKTVFDCIENARHKARREEA